MKQPKQVLRVLEYYQEGRKEERTTIFLAIPRKIYTGLPALVVLCLQMFRCKSDDRV